jgi:hypothetical protein
MYFLSWSDLRRFETDLRRLRKNRVGGRTGGFNSNPTSELTLRNKHKFLVTIGLTGIQRAPPGMDGRREAALMLPLEFRLRKSRPRLYPNGLAGRLPLRSLLSTISYPDADLRPFPHDSKALAWRPRPGPSLHQR